MIGNVIYKLRFPYPYSHPLYCNSYETNPSSSLLLMVSLLVPSSHGFSSRQFHSGKLSFVSFSVTVSLLFPSLYPWLSSLPFALSMTLFSLLRSFHDSLLFPSLFPCLSSSRKEACMHYTNWFTLLDSEHTLQVTQERRKELGKGRVKLHPCSWGCIQEMDQEMMVERVKEKRRTGCENQTLEWLIIKWDEREREKLSCFEHSHS